MIKRIFIFFSCCLLFLQLSITAFAGVPAGEFSDWYNSTNQSYSLTDLSSIYYAGSMFAGKIKPPFDLGDDFSEKKAIFFFSNDNSRLNILYLSNDTESVLFNTADEVFSSDGTLKFVSRNIDYDNSSFTSGSSTTVADSDGSVDISSARGFGEFIYSSVDIYDQNGNLFKEHSYGEMDYQTYYEPNLNVSYYPELSLETDFSYENVGGSRDEYGRPITTIAYDYNITGTVDYSGSWTYQYCVLVSEKPPEVVYEEGLNPTLDNYYVDFDSYRQNSIYTVCQDTYYWCTYNNPNYGDIDFVQAKGVIAWFVSTPGKESHFNLNLQRVPGFTSEKTYYITVWGFELTQGEAATFTYMPWAMSFSDLKTYGHDIKLVDCTQFGCVSEQLVDYEDTSSENRFMQSDNSFVDFTSTDDNLFNGGIIPESAVETPTTEGITGPITSIKPSTGSNANYGDATFSGMADNFKSFVLFCQSCYSVMPVQVSNLLFYLVCVMIAFVFVAIVIKLIPR